MESRAVMPGPPQDGDEPDLIRTDFGNLESAAWWKSHQLDGVVLYAWGRPKYRKIARAIREAGIFLVLNQDNGGLVSPLAGPGEWWDEQWTLHGGEPCASIRQIVRGLTIGLGVIDPLRAIHLHQGDIIACVSPGAAEFYQTLCRFYGGPSLANRIRVIPHPVEPSFRYPGEPKHRQVICVGRWDDAIQKRPHLLMQVAGILVARDPDLRLKIVGNPTPEIRSWHARLDAEKQERIMLAGRLDRVALAAAMAESRIFYSPSAYESFGIAAAEALCCGCSVVAGKSVSMISFEWFTGENSGRLAEDQTPESHAAAILQELDAWDHHQRNADQISRTWSTRLHATHVATAILQESSIQQPTPSPS